MPPSSEEILSPSRAELARGRPRAALSEMERARGALLAASDVGGLWELLDLARGIRTLAPVDTNARERLLEAIERDIRSLSPGGVHQAVSKPEDVPDSPPPSVLFSPYASLSTEQILAPARSEIERQKTGRALRQLEKARRKLLARGEIEGFEGLIELTTRLPLKKPRHRSARDRLIYAAGQNIGYLNRRAALNAGEDWHDPSSSVASKASTPSLPAMTQREKLIAVAVAVALASGIAGLALLDRAPQRMAHAIKCPTGEQGSPTWSPDGKEIAFAKNRECGTQITVISVENGRLRTVSNGYGVLPDWSPDGRTILYRSRDGFSVVSEQGGKSRLIRSDDGDMGASWSPDGEWIAFTHGQLHDDDLSFTPYESTLYVMDRDGRRTRRIVGHECDPGTPSWRPSDGELSFACSGHLSGIYVFRQSNRKLVLFAGVPFDNTAYAPRNVSWSPDGREVAFGRNGVEVASSEAEGSSSDDLLPPPIAQVDLPGFATIDVAWAPDGKHIAFSVIGSGSDDGLYVIDRDGSHRRRLVAF